MVEAITEPTPLSKVRIDKRYSVLSLDGGGVRGLMTTNILAEIEQQIETRIGKPFKITDAFDCVIGTSAGGLLAIGLSAGYSARELKATVMDEMIEQTFSSKRWKAETWFKPMYDETKLEDQIRKHIYTKLDLDGAREPTMADLAAKNPKLRTLITSIKYKFDEKHGGPQFTPKIFDTLNPHDNGKLVLHVARSTSAAPVYFAPQIIKDDKTGEENQFVDGGVFANNPSGWGFALSALNVKAENIRLISVGTGYRDYDLKDEEDGGFFKDIWNKTKNYFNGMKDTALQWAHWSDSDGKKSGFSSWLSVEIVGKAIFDVQKQGEQLLDLYKGVMKNNYYRINPSLSKDIELDKFEQKPEMERQLARYMDLQETKALIETVISSILTADNYYDKALQNLHKSAVIIKYGQYLTQQATDEQRQQAALIVKILSKYVEDIEVSEDAVKAHEAQIVLNLENLGRVFKSDMDYPTIKRNPKE
eukprot:403336801